MSRLVSVQLPHLPRWCALDSALRSLSEQFRCCIHQGFSTVGARSYCPTVEEVSITRYRTPVDDQRVPIIFGQAHQGLTNSPRPANWEFVGRKLAALKEVVPINEIIDTRLKASLWQVSRIPIVPHTPLVRLRLRFSLFHGSSSVLLDGRQTATHEFPEEFRSLHPFRGHHYHQPWFPTVGTRSSMLVLDDFGTLKL